MKKQITAPDLCEIFDNHAKDKTLKEMNLIVLDSTSSYGATMNFDDAINDKKGKKSMQKLADRINEYFLKL